MLRTSVGCVTWASGEWPGGWQEVVPDHRKWCWLSPGWSMLSWTVRGTLWGWHWQGDVIDSRRVTGTGWCLTDNSSFSLLMNRQSLEMALCETLNQRNWEKQKAKLCGGYLALSIGSIITHSNVPAECCIYAMKSVGTGTNSNCLPHSYWAWQCK